MSAKLAGPLYRGSTAILILYTQIFENWVREKMISFFYVVIKAIKNDSMADEKYLHYI